MKPYDPDKRYFGPQGSKLCAIIPEYPRGIPQIQQVFNKAGYNHDGGYEGEKRKGFWGWFKDARDRYRIDKKLLADLLSGIDYACERGMITGPEADECDAYAHQAYIAIRAGGWMYFRTDGEG